LIVNVCKVAHHLPRLLTTLAFEGCCFLSLSRSTHMLSMFDIILANRASAGSEFIPAC
jgi:hypothetical protein